MSGEFFQRGPRALSDGETVLFASGRPSANETRIGIASLTTGRTDYLDIPDASPEGVVDGNLIYPTSAGLLMAAPFDVAGRRLTGSPVNVADGILVTNLGTARAWVSASGSLLYRSGSIGGQLVVTAPAGDVTTLLTEPKSYIYPRLSPDGNRIALTIESGSSLEVWIHDIGSNTTTRFSSEGTLNSMPEWTPDGRRMLYASNRSGNNALWWQNADFSGRAELLQAFEGGRVDEGVISPDGQYLVFRTSDRQSGQDILVPTSPRGHNLATHRERSCT